MTTNGGTSNKRLTPMKHFMYNSMVLAILFAPMNVLSRLPYRMAWEQEGWAGKIFVGFLVLVLWSFMHYMLETRIIARQNEGV